MQTSTDKPFAEMVARHIGSIHYHIDVTEDECLEALDKIPGVIGSIDITSNRASCLQYKLLEYISKNTNFKIVLCGDGSDEVFFSYKYFVFVACYHFYGYFNYSSLYISFDLWIFMDIQFAKNNTACRSVGEYTYNLFG